MSLSAVVMAAGEGTRLRPLTERWAKPLLPIEGRPVLASLLRELAAAGFERITIVTGHLAEQVEAFVGDGSAFGTSVAFVRQPERLGSADAVRRAVEWGAVPPLLVSAADTVFVAGDVARVVQAWTASAAAGALAIRRGGRSEQTAARVEDGRLQELGGASRGLTAAPLWVLGEELCAALPAVPGPPFEIASAVHDALAAGKEIAAVEVGPTKDLTRPADVMALNFPYLLDEAR